MLIRDSRDLRLEIALEHEQQRLVRMPVRRRMHDDEGAAANGSRFHIEPNKLIGEAVKLLRR